MPTLLEVQQAMRGALFGGAGSSDHAGPGPSDSTGPSRAGGRAGAPVDTGVAAVDSASPESPLGLGDGTLEPVPGLGASALERLSIYRNTCRSTLANALRLSFPAVRRLVGEEFFEGAVQRFIDEAAGGIPGSAWLNEYGRELAAFLASFPPAMGLPYLADVARLEWAVNGALHAPDAARLDAARLGAAQVASRTRESAEVRFVAHPSIGLLSLRYPADTIWRAVLKEDDAALAAVDLASGPVWLLVERDEAGVQVRRLTEREWRLTERLCAGAPLQAALEESPDGAAMLLAEHLSAGRFTDVLLEDGDAPPSSATHEASGASAGVNHPSGDRVP